MTAKEALLERVKALTEEEAERLLRELPEEPGKPARKPLNQVIAEIWADVPEEELERLGSSDDIDAVLRAHGR